MSNHTCEHCGAECIDSPRGYVTGCEHYSPDVKELNMKTATKERPILFSAPMVKAILDGRKTVTRRIVKPQPKAKHLGYMAVDGGAIQCGPDYPDGDEDFVRCPYGQPGDRLWVRESFLPCLGSGTPCKPSEASYVCFRDGAQKYPHTDESIPWCLGISSKPPTWEGYRFSPSIYMPRWASRITLEIVSVRVERVQEITSADIRLEGFDCPIHDLASGMCVGYCKAIEEKFRETWDALNKKRGYGWESNPWVWRVEFRRLP